MAADLADLIARCEQAEGLADPRTKVRRTLDRLVGDMAVAGYPVEMTHKRGHASNFIPDEHWTIESDEGAEEALAWLIVGAWTSKHALIEAFRLARKYQREDVIASLRARAQGA